MSLDHLLIRDECGNHLGRIAHGSDGWDWRCAGCSTTTSEFFLSASEAMASFEAHVEGRHP